MAAVRAPRRRRKERGLGLMARGKGWPSPQRAVDRMRASASRPSLALPDDLSPGFPRPPPFPVTLGAGLWPRAWTSLARHLPRPLPPRSRKGPRPGLEGMTTEGGSSSPLTSFWRRWAAFFRARAPGVAHVAIMRHCINFVIHATVPPQPTPLQHRRASFPEGRPRLRAGCRGPRLPAAHARTPGPGSRLHGPWSKSTLSAGAAAACAPPSGASRCSFGAPAGEASCFFRSFVFSCLTSFPPFFLLLFFSSRATAAAFLA